MIRNSLLIAMLALVLAACSDRSAPSSESGFVPSKQTPALVVETFQGGKFDLAEYRGKWVVVNFWATWCAPCLKEIPDLLRLQQEKESEGVRLIGVAVDEPTANSAEVERFRSRYFPSFRTYARAGAEMDELARVIDPTWNEVVPTTYFLDRDGRVVKRIQGKRTLEEFRLALEAISQK
jgi:thiol-disulfide isomerase/thioredoxin